MACLYRLILFSLVCILLLSFTPGIRASPDHAASLPIPAHIAPAPTSSVFGINSHIASRSIHQQTLPVAADLLAETGAGWAREDFFWYRIEEQPGQYDWEFFDNTVLLMRERDINVIGVLGPSVGWATPYPDDIPHDVSYYPPDPQLYAEFVSTVVSRYKDLVHYWQIWNEPDNSFYWKPQPDPTAYAELLKVAYPAIKAANPDAQVLVAGLVPFDLSFFRSLAEQGAWNSFDIIAINPYGDPFSPEEGQIGTAGVSAVRILAEQYGPKPIWATEFGWATGPSDRDPSGSTDAEMQANFLVRSMVLLRAAGAERVLWYKLKDTDVNNPYGLFSFGSALDDYSNPKPSLAAFRTLNQQLANTRLVGPQEMGERQVSLDFEEVQAWEPASTATASLTRASTHAHSGSFSARLDYQFATIPDQYAGFRPETTIAIDGAPAHIGLWVYGDGSGHVLRLHLRDAEGEVLQFRLGYVDAPGWQFLSAPITGRVPAYNQISGAQSGNRRIDYPINLEALLLGSERDDTSTSGSIYLDDLTAVSGPDAYCIRFAKENGSVDVLWAPQPAQVAIPTTASQATLVDRSGTTTTVIARNGSLTLNLGPSPLYLYHEEAPAPGRFPLPALPSAPTPSSQSEPATPPPTTGSTPENNATNVVAIPLPADGSFADSAFQQVWERTDLPLTTSLPGLQQRSWIWGPQPLTAGMREPYAEGVGGERLVQYFDKSRMERNNPSGPRDQWYVTNGLLVVEMITGQVQVGNHSFEAHQPAEQAIAGDRIEINPDAPTYRALRQVAYPINLQRAPNRQGEMVTEVLHYDRVADISVVTPDPTMIRYNVIIGAYERELGHNIPAVFTDFFAQQGLVYEDGNYQTGQIIDWRFVLGLPISEPYWARVRIGGVEKDVLIQAFQRRVLTYTPTNEPSWRVEMGNVGEHYLRWRYNW